MLARKCVLGQIELLRNRTNYPKNKSINYDLFGIWFLFLCTNGNLHIVFSWYLVEVDTTSLQKIVLPSLLIRRLTFHSARKMRTYGNICFCYGKITYQSALKSYFAQIVELVNKKSDPSNFQRFRNQDQFCLNNGLYPSRTYSKWPLHDFYQISKLMFFLFFLDWAII